jgi:hypothetical protein
MARFNAEDGVLYSKVQVSEGTAVTLADANAILMQNVSYEDNISSETLTYAGDSQSRDVDVISKDYFATIKGDFFLPARGDDTGLSTIADFPLLSVFQAAKLKGALTGTTPNKIITLENLSEISSKLTEGVYFTASGLATAKKYGIFDAVVNLDLDIEIDSRAKFTRTAKGTVVLPAQVTKLVPDYGEMRTNIMPTVTAANISVAELTPSTETHTGTSGTVKNVCFTKLSFPNIAGFDFKRMKDSCQSTFDPVAVNNDITLTVLDKEAIAIGDESASLIDPYNHINDHFKFTLKWGTIAGFKASLYFSDIILTDIGSTTVNENKLGKDLKFTNAGYVTLILS